MSCIFLLQFLMGRLVFQLAHSYEIEDAGWSSAGVALAAFLIFKYRIWPPIFLGVLAVNLAGGVPLGLGCGIAVGKTLEGALAAFFIHRYAGGRRVFEGVRNIILFLLLVGALCTAVDAAFGVLNLCLFGHRPWSSLESLWLNWWLGDIPRAAILSSLYVLWYNQPRIDWPPAKWLEAALTFLFLFWATREAFGGWLVFPHSNYSRTFFITPAMLWVAYRFTQRETATAVFLVSAIAVVRTLDGEGPFAGAGRSTTLLLLQFYLVLTWVAVMILTTAVNEGKKSNESLRKAQMELLRSNTDLERFAHLASHDMREPLRMITNYLQLLSARYKSRLDSDADEFIGYAVGGARRLAALLEALVAYSRLDGKGMELKPVSLEEVFLAAADNLRMKIAETGAQITHGPLPGIMGDKIQMVQLLQNLFANAIKFHGKQKPVIRLTAEAWGDEWVLKCQDNGIGIDPENFGRIFQIFQRLHTHEEYEGTGVGLAVCKRIVERHGGRIWVESQPGSGSAFYFTLPVEKKLPGNMGS